VFSICAPGGLFPEARGLLPSSHFQILEEWTPENRARSEAWLVRAPHAIDTHILEKAPLLRLVVMQGTGIDHINSQACEVRKIKVQNVPGVNANAAAEWTLLLLLSLFRKFLPALQGAKAEIWKREDWMGNELSGKILGLVGLGHVGKSVAKKAQAFGMSVRAYDPYIEPAIFHKFGVESISREELFRTCDAISLHLPLTAETRESVGKNEFSWMKANAIFINTARGEIVFEEDLLAALDKNLSGAALDVFTEEPLPREHKFLTHSKVICTPHMAGQSYRARLEIQKQACEQILEYFNLRKGK